MKLKGVIVWLGVGVMLGGQLSATRVQASTMVTHDSGYTIYDTTKAIEFKVTNRTKNQYVLSKKTKIYQRKRKKNLHRVKAMLKAGTVIKLVRKSKKKAWIKVLRSKKYRGTYYIHGYSKRIYSSHIYAWTSARKRLLRLITSEWNKRLSKSQKKAIRAYTDIDYTYINSYYRKTKKYVAKKYRIEGSLITKALQSFSYPYGATYYRGTSMSSVKKCINTKKAQVGSTFKDKGFTSASSDKSVAAQFEDGVIMRYIIPAKKKVGAYIATVSESPHEQEYLINRRKKFVITQIGKVKFRIRDTVVVKNKKGKETSHSSYTYSQTVTLITLFYVK